MEQRYYRYSKYLKDKFGCTVYKVSVDAGFNCPNIDGKLSKAGCIYCDNKTFSFNTRSKTLKPLREQIEAGMDFGKRRHGAKKFIIYFQAHTNTYADYDVLKQRYDEIKSFKNIVGINIGTRPDCINEGILDLIQGYSKDYDVWVEYGLQSADDKTLKFINRNHTYEDFKKAAELTRARDIKVCAHIIIGLPNEGKKEIIGTAKELGRLKIEGVKIHPLYIAKGTVLEKLFKKDDYKPLELEEFVNLSASFLEHLAPTAVIQRIGADCPEDLLIAPHWILNKNLVLEKLEKYLETNKTYQGKLYGQ